MRSNEELLRELEMYKRDGLVYLYYSLNKKLNQLSEAIDKTNIDLTASDDKSFDRLMKAMVESRSIAENLKWLRIEFRITGDEEKDKRAADLPIETFAKTEKNGKGK